MPICVWTCDMTSRSYFGKINSTLGSVVPLAMFINKEDTKTIIANQLEGILIGLAMFLWHHNIISIVECSVVLLSTLTELVTKLLERQLFSCVLTQCNFKQTSTESLSNKQKEFKDKVVSVTKKRKRRKVYYICWVIQIGLIILRRQVQVARGRSPGDGQRWEQNCLAWDGEIFFGEAGWQLLSHRIHCVVPGQLQGVWAGWLLLGGHLLE